MLAGLAAGMGCGLASAQVQVTGKLGFGLNKTQPLPSTQAAINAGQQGMQVTDGEVTFTAVEDLGGGYKATAEATQVLRGRETAITAKDATLALLTPVGQLTAGASNTESSQRMSWGDTKISLPSDPAGDNFDFAAFTTKVGPVYASLSYAETGSKDVSDLATAFSAVLTGSAAGNTVSGGPGAGGGPLQVSTLDFRYYGDALALKASASVYTTRTGFMSDPGAAGLIKSIYEGRTDTKLELTYDFNVAKVGFGTNIRNKGWANETNASVSVPAGAWSFGLTYEHKGDDTQSLGAGTSASQFAGSTLGVVFPTLTGGDIKGTAERWRWRLGAEYALSKSSAFNVSYGEYRFGSAERRGALALAQPNNVSTNEYQVKFVKSF